MAVIGQREFAAFAACDTAAHKCRIEMAEINERNAIARRQIGIRSRGRTPRGATDQSCRPEDPRSRSHSGATAQHIAPARVSFINASLHLEERESRSGYKKFLRNADLLRCKGFSILVSLVATPMALARFEGAIALLKPVGLFPIPKLLGPPPSRRP